MAKLKSVLTDLIKKAGIDLDKNEQASLMLAASSLNEIEVPEEVVKELNRNLMDMATARNEISLKNHFTSQFAHGLEETYFTMLEELGVGKDEIDEIKSASTSTGKKLAASKEKIASLIAKAAKENGKNGNEELKKQIEEAKKAYDLKLQESQTQLQTLQAKIRQKAEESAYEKKFGNLNLKGIPKEDTVEYMKMKFNKWVAEKNAALIFDEEKEDFVLKNAADKTLDFTIDGKIYSVDEFLSVNLQTNNLLGSESGGSDIKPGSNFPDPDKGNGAPQLSRQKAHTLGTIAEGLTAAMQ